MTWGIRTLCRITCQVPRLLSPVVRRALEGTGLIASFVQAGRTVQIRERKLPFYPVAITGLEENRCDIFQLYLPPEAEQTVLERIIFGAGLEMADRGSVYSEDVEQVLWQAPEERSGEMNDATPNGDARDSKRVPLVNDLTGICCILPRGLGDVVGRAALEMGICVPAISFGTGTGLRDRLGLLRVVIPAEKELLTLVVPRHDAEGLARRLVESARLAQPGRGFVYLYPIKRGLLNIKLWIGPQRHAANINQLVAAVDSLWGGAGWRRRVPMEERGQQHRAPRFQRDLVEITLICPEDQNPALLRAAMDAGSGGATSRRISRLGAGENSVEGLPAGRLLTTMVIPTQRRKAVLSALGKAGLFDQDPAGSLMFLTQAPLAYSYVHHRPDER